MLEATLMTPTVFSARCVSRPQRDVGAINVAG
jgi:hypothetical protein